MKKISENEIEIDGKIYQKEQGHGYNCDGCFLEKKCDLEFNDKMCDLWLSCKDSIWIPKQSSFNDLITRNYATVQKRGQLSETAYELIQKIEAELDELKESCADTFLCENFDPSEAIDVILSTCTLLQKFGYDFMAEMEKKVIFNENRKD